MGFDARDVALELVRSLRPLVEKIRQKDASLANQLRDAGSSVVLNVGEGARRTGRDRRYHYTVASGSAGEERLHPEHRQKNQRWKYGCQEAVIRLHDRHHGQHRMKADNDHGHAPQQP